MKSVYLNKNWLQVIRIYTNTVPKLFYIFNSPFFDLNRLNYINQFNQITIFINLNEMIESLFND